MLFLPFIGFGQSLHDNFNMTEKAFQSFIKAQKIAHIAVDYEVGKPPMSSLSYRYDTEGRLLSYAYSTQNEVFEDTYTYNDAGKILEIKHLYEGYNVVNGNKIFSADTSFMRYFYKNGRIDYTESRKKEGIKKEYYTYSGDTTTVSDENQILKKEIRDSADKILSVILFRNAESVQQIKYFYNTDASLQILENCSAGFCHQTFYFYTYNAEKQVISVEIKERIGDYTYIVNQKYAYKGGKLHELCIINKDGKNKEKYYYQYTYHNK